MQLSSFAAHYRLALAPWLVVAAAGCGGTNAFAPPDERIRSLLVVSGDGQAAPAGTTLPDPVIVMALDEEGVPLPGVTLRASAPGRIEPAVIRTGAGGEAAFRWTLPDDVGYHEARILAPHSRATDPPGVSVTATALAGVRSARSP